MTRKCATSPTRPTCSRSMPPSRQPAPARPGAVLPVVADEVQTGRRNPASRPTRSIPSPLDHGAIRCRAGSHQRGKNPSTPARSWPAKVEGVLTHSRDAVMQSRHGVNDITESVSEQKVASTKIAQSMERIANMVEETNAAARSVSTSTGDLRTRCHRTSPGGLRVSRCLRQTGSRPAAAGTTTQTPASRGRRFIRQAGRLLLDRLDGQVDAPRHRRAGRTCRRNSERLTTV